MIGELPACLLCGPKASHHPNHTTITHTHTHATQLLSPSTYTEMSRFDPIGAGFMLSIDDDGYFTVSSDPRVSVCVIGSMCWSVGT